MKTNKYLFLFTIGPVQSFIAQARKTQDLWAGSYLLSFLTWEAIKYLIEKQNIDVNDFIFPDLKEQSFYKYYLKNEAEYLHLPTIPNRFLLKINDYTEKDIKGLGKALKNEINKIFKEIVSKSLDDIKGIKLQDKKINEIIDRQSKNFLEIYWVAIPEDEQDNINENNYSKWYNFAESALGARKNFRSFNQVSEKGLKCSSCGEREVLHDDKHNTFWEMKDYWKDIRTKNTSKFRNNETLCSICAMKRFTMKYISKNYFDDRIAINSFSSTAEIALLNQIPKEKFKELGQDAQLFYDENLTKSYFDKNGINEKIEKVKEKRDNILKKLKLKPSQLTKYYAVLFMDGDDMGKHLSDVRSIEQHKKLSKSLIQFAKKQVRKIIEEENKGKLIYSGGEDVAALVNLKDIFRVMDKLHKKFSEIIGKEFPNKKITASIGVCITHYKTPLNIALDYARKMEKEAKLLPNKNAFGLTLLSHSGNMRQTVSKWEYDDLKIIDFIEQITDLLTNDNLSKKFMYVFREEFKNTINEDDNKFDLPISLFQKEAERILNRQMNFKNKDERKKEAEELSDKLMNLLLAFNKNYQLFIHFLEIVIFISKQNIKEAKNDIKD